MKQPMFISRTPVVPVRGIHLDLKGNPPTPARLLTILDLCRSLRLNAVLAEWEDTFPWRRYPALRSPTAYTPAEIDRFARRADDRGVEVIPLVQCLGHSENVLRLPEFRSLREQPDHVSEFCASNPRSRQIVIELVDDVLDRLGSRVRRFHLGGDEARHMGSCPRCRAAVRARGKDRVYLEHVGPILDHLAARGVRPILWDDMMRSWPDAALRELGGRADLMAWCYYARPVEKKDGFLNEGHLAKYRRCGVRAWAGSAYKGADGAFIDVPDVRERTANNLGWAQQARARRMVGMIATAWSRYDTFMAPCETIETSLDLLVVAAAAMWDGRLPADPIPAARARLGRVAGGRELRRFLACRKAAGNLQGWREGLDKWFLAEREYGTHLSGEPARRNPGEIALLDAKIRRQFRSGERLCREFIRAHRGLIPDRWLKLYTRSRITPLTRRFRNMLQVDGGSMGRRK